MARSARHVRLALALASTAGIALAACGGGGGSAPAAGPAAPGSWEAVVEAAKQEGALTFYANTNEPANQALIEEFQNLYPEIKITYTRIPNAEVTSRIVAEAESGINAVDVVATGVPELADGHGDLFKEMTTDFLPGMAKFPDTAKRYPWATVTVTNAYAVGYNTDLVPEGEAPKSWQDVLDPKWKGQIAYATPVGSTTHLGWLQGMKHFFGDQFLATWRTQDYQLMDSATPAAQAVAAGSNKLAVIVYPGSLTDLIDKGAPIKYVIPTPVLVKGAILLVAAKSPHPNAARLFANFMLSEKGLSLVCESTDASAPVADIPGCIDVPADAYQVQDIWTPADQQPYYDALGLKPRS